MSKRWERSIEDPPAFVGRDQEMARLRHALQRTLKGRGGLVLVSGEAGIGKSTLVRHLVHDADAAGALVLSGAAYDLSATPPYGPWLELIREYPGNEHLPPLPEFFTSQEAVASFGSQEALHQGVLAFFNEVGQVRPLLLVLEDLHWSDQPSLDLFRLLVRSIHKQEILVVATYRDDEVARQHALYRLLPSLIRESSAERIDLRTLGESAIQTLIEQQFNLETPDRERLVRYLLSRGEGNPLFTVELLRTLVLEGMLQSERGVWRIQNLTTDSVPILVRQAVERRMQDLSDETTRALQLAAVLGQVVPLARWQEVTGVPIGSAAEEALEAQLVDETTDGNGVVFRHALIREAIYRTVPLPRRRQFHNQIANMYLTDPRPDPEMVAWHLKQAGDPQASEWLVRAAEQAEQRLAWTIALERHDEAVNILREQGEQAQILSRVLLRMGRLLRFLDQKQAVRYFEESRKLALQSGDRVTAAFALFNIGAHQPNPGSEQSRFTKMLNAIDTLENTDRDTKSIGKWAVTRVAVDIDPLLTLRSSCVLQLAWSGRPHDAVDLGKQHLPENWDSDLVELAEFSDHYPSISNADAYAGLGRAFSLLGQPHNVKIAHAISMELGKRIEFRPVLALYCNDQQHDYHFPYCAANLEQRSELLALIDSESGAASELTGAGNATYSLDYGFLMEGRWDELRRRIRSGVTPTIYHLRYLSLLARARFALYEGNLGRVRDILTQLLPVGAGENPEDYAHPIPGEPHRISTMVALAEDDTIRARELMTTHDTWMEWTGAVRGRAEGLLLWAQIHLAEGNKSAALDAAYRARNWASNPQQPIALIAIHRFLGQLATCANDYPTAADYLTRSHDLAAACALPFELARTSIALAKLEIARGSPAEARAPLANALRICTELGATPTLNEIASIAATLRPRKGDDRFGLTARELDVLQHLVQGMSDKEIAEELFISPRTVMHHVASILRKMEVESRTAAAAMAVREKLV